MSLVIPEKFQRVLRVLNTNIDGQRKITFAITAIKVWVLVVLRKVDMDLTKRAGELTEDEVERVITIMQNPRFKCPVCSKFVSSDEMDLHLVMCLTKPRITYNEDVLSKDAGECAICLEELQQGDTIARLPCLCIYHKGCIDEWFEVNRSCPEHPSD
ncbi:unnamed protein product [Caretta caretta]